jgi:hypothetical protein
MNAVTDDHLVGATIWQQELFDVLLAHERNEEETTGAQRREMRANRERRRSGSARTESAGQPYGVNDCHDPQRSIAP